ncbi:MAG: hypothetical protein WAP35_01710 [Solirubrobacterales bacterium]
MARTWLQIKVDLTAGHAVSRKPSPGRIFIVGPGHTFEQFADSINLAFARWDLAHLHAFELADGRRIGIPDDFFEPELTFLDHAKHKVTREVKPGDQFEFVFDFGDNWRHQCIVLDEKADPVKEYGFAPDAPVPTWGWGSIPDQYGRESFDDLGM